MACVSILSKLYIRSVSYLNTMPFLIKLIIRMTALIRGDSEEHLVHRVY